MLKYMTARLCFGVWEGRSVKWPTFGFLVSLSPRMNGSKSTEVNIRTKLLLKEEIVE